MADELRAGSCAAKMEMFPNQSAAEPARRARRKPALCRWKRFPIRATREYLLALLPAIPDMRNRPGLLHASLGVPCRGECCPPREFPIPRTSLRNLYGRPLYEPSTVVAALDAANGHDSSEPRPHRWCLQKETSTSATQRGRRRKTSWLCLGGGNNSLLCFRNNPANYLFAKEMTCHL